MSIPGLQQFEQEIATICTSSFRWRALAAITIAPCVAPIRPKRFLCHEHYRDIGECDDYTAIIDRNRDEAHY